MRKLIVVLALALSALPGSLRAQTINLPNRDNVDFIDYMAYANLFDSDIPVTINGVPFFVSLSAHFQPDKTIYTPYSSIQFWNQTLECQSAYPPPNCRVAVPLTGTISGYKYVLNEVGPTIQASFSGLYSGTLTLNLLPHPVKQPCFRFCYQFYWAQVNSTITLTSTP